MSSKPASVSPFGRGISNSSVRIGVLLPPRDVLPELAAAVAAPLIAWTDELNARGGVTRRRVDLFFESPTGTARERAEATREMVRRERLFALVASFTDGADEELSEAAAALEVPLLATISAYPASATAPNHYLRDLSGGVVEQSAALMTAVGGGSIAVLHDRKASADSLLRHARAAGIEAECLEVTAATAASLREANPAAVLFAVSGGVAEPLLLEMSAMNWWPPLLLPGGAVAPRFLDRLRPRSAIWLAVPSAAQDRTPEAIAAYNGLATRHMLPQGHQLSQFAALTSVQLFADAFGRAHDARREAFLAAIDATDGFHSGLFPPLTYGPGRHIGSRGSWIFALHEPAPPRWVEVDATS